MSLYLNILLRNIRFFSFPRILNTLIYFLTRPFIKILQLKNIPYGPVSVFIWITTRCSKSCHFCPYVEELNTAAKNDDLSVEDFLNLYNESPFLSKNLHLAFYGGEPFLNKDLFKMIREAKKKGHIVTTTTNALHLKQRQYDLQRDPPDFLTVSYYHEDLAHLKEQLPFIPKTIVRRLNFILSLSTIQHIESALTLAMEHGFDYFSIDPISDKQRVNDQLIFTDSPLFLELKNKLLSLSSNSKIKIKFPNTLKHRYLNSPGCFFAWDTVYLVKDQRWAPCCEWPLPQYQGPKDQSWNGAWLQKRRQNLLESANDCGPCHECTYRYDSTMGV